MNPLLSAVYRYVRPFLPARGPASRRQANQIRKSLPPALRVELLEERQLLSGGTVRGTIQFHAGQLTIIGSDGANRADVHYNADRTGVHVTLKSSVSAESPPISLEGDYIGATSITFYGGAGGDVFRNFTEIRARAFGGPGDDVFYGGNGGANLDGGGGNDVLIGGLDHDLLEGGPGSDTLVGNGGHDVLIGGPGRGQDRILDDTNGGDYFTIWVAIGPDVFGKPVGDPVTLPAKNIEYQQFEHGIIVGPIGQPAVPLYGDLYDRWRQLGGLDGPFAFPVSARVSIEHTIIQDFENGWMVSNPTAGILAATGGSSANFPLLVSDAAMLGPGLSLTDPNSLGLWTSIVDDIKKAAADIGKILDPDPAPDYTDLRTGIPGNPTPPVLPPELPSPFHYDPNLLKVTAVQEKHSFNHTLIYRNGAVVALDYFGSTRAGEHAYWSEQVRLGDVLNEVERRLDTLVGSDGILLDPVFGAPIKFLLVDQIFNPTNNQLYEGLAGYNASSFDVYTNGSTVTDAKAARVIEIVKWDGNDPTQQEFAVRTFIHEIGHSWNAFGAPTTGVNNTPWLLQHKSVFDRFLALSGWTTKDGGKTWTTTAGRDAFASDYAMDGAGHPSPNEDWAETFELASRPGLSLDSLSKVLRQKVELILGFLRAVVTTDAALGGLEFELEDNPAKNT